MPGKDSCLLFLCKSPTVSCSSPKQDPRPPFKLFLSFFPLPKCQPQHASSKFPSSPSQPAPPPAPYSPGLLQHSNPDPNTGALNPPALLLYTAAAPSGKGPSPTAVRPQPCAPYLPSNPLSSYYCSFPS